MRMDLSSDELQQFFVTLFELVKMKKTHSSIMMGKLREGNQFVLQINGSLSLPLNMALICIKFQSIGYSVDLRDDILSRVMPLL